jgi:hypothetical protein
LNNQSIDDLLASHIVQGLYYTSNITNATVIQTLAGTNITFAKNDTGFIGKIFFFLKKKYAYFFNVQLTIQILFNPTSYWIWVSCI